MLKKLLSRMKPVDGGESTGGQPPYEIEEQGLIFAIDKSSESWEISAYLEQLFDEDLVAQLTDSWLLPWDSLYQLIESEDHQSSLHLLRLPPFSTLLPQLFSQGSIADQAFGVFIKGWRDPVTERDAQPQRTGAVVEYSGRIELLPQASWQLIRSIRELQATQRDNPGEATNQIGWSKVRRLAQKANAGMDGFLTKTIILRPESLKLNMRKSGLDSAPVIEVEPAFEGQPNNWLSTFDGYDQVQDRYHISDKDGSITHVLISPEVRTVLETVRAMPGRRVAGDNALSFIKNPYSFLGDDAVKVLDSDAYEKELADSGIYFYKFLLAPVLDESGTKISTVFMRLDAISPTPQPCVDIQFNQAHEFSPFVNELRYKFAAELPAGFWKGYELELTDLTLEQLQGLEALLDRWQKEAAGQEFHSVLDLSQYGDRVIGIGAAEKISSPFLVKEKSEQWLPGSELSLLGLDGELLSKWDSSKRADFDEFGSRIKTAKLESKDRVFLPSLEIPLDIPIAEQLYALWSRKFPDDLPIAAMEKAERAVLLVENNIEESSYIQQREAALNAGHSAQMDIPELLKTEIELRDHQKKGVAWLQHLFSISPTHVSGCLLADDMGLGKTLQLLAFIVWYIEKNPDGDPALIVAPVSLLDNWERELSNFFYADSLPVLKLYGQTLNQFKFRKDEIPKDLIERGIRNLLKPGWLGEQKIVLTTYETLRDQEFSLARKRWAIVVCDEAQKIKNPAALVTQAANAMKARFRVACTGTPVENSLTDLWCLFDFIQPGLLGGLNQFGTKFRRPIESQTEADNSALEELKQIIDPQILRRTKKDVAKDLPEKLEDKTCRRLPMQTNQRDLYLSELSIFEQKKALMDQLDKKAGGILGLLHTLKLICAHPFSIRPQPILRDQSPKLRWLLSTLDTIKSRGEKAIIFTELRDIQREVQHLVESRFDLQVTIINGDTNANSQKGTSRQGLIDRFQEKPGFGVIILSTVAVGFGVNVQAANHVIHFTRCWNPAKEDQATDRAYRIGQTKDVTVYYPTVVADGLKTFEETLDQLLAKKRVLAEDMFNGVSDIEATEFAEVFSGRPI